MAVIEAEGTFAPKWACVVEYCKIVVKEKVVYCNDLILKD